MLLVGNFFCVVLLPCLPEECVAQLQTPPAHGRVLQRLWFCASHVSVLPWINFSLFYFSLLRSLKDPDLYLLWSPFLLLPSNYSFLIQLQPQIPLLLSLTLSPLLLPLLILADRQFTPTVLSLTWACHLGISYESPFPISFHNQTLDNSHPYSLTSSLNNFSS